MLSSTLWLLEYFISTSAVGPAAGIQQHLRVCCWPCCRINTSAVQLLFNTTAIPVPQDAPHFTSSTVVHRAVWFINFQHKSRYPVSTVIVYPVQERDVKSTVKCTGIHAASSCKMGDSYCACAERRKPAVNTNLRTSMNTCTANKDLPVVCDCHNWPGTLQTTPLRKLYERGSGLAVTKCFLGNDPTAASHNCHMQR